MRRKNATSKSIDKKTYFNHRKEWTLEDDEELKVLSEYLSDIEISKQIGRTVPSICNRRMTIYD